MLTEIHTRAQRVAELAEKLVEHMPAREADRLVREIRAEAEALTRACERDEFEVMVSRHASA